MKMNDNCLENIKCPKCGNDEMLSVRAHVWLDVTDDGSTEDEDRPHEWADDSLCECRCGYAAFWADFKV